MIVPTISPTLGLYSETPSWGGGGGGTPAGVTPAQTQPASVATGTIGNNLANVAALNSLAQGSGAASGAGQVANLNVALPGAQTGIENLLALSQKDLSGQLDPSTINNIEQAAAERGIAIGDPSSPNANAAMLAALGQTTQQLEQTGAQDLASAVGLAPVGPAYNPQQQQMTPAEALQAENENAQRQQQANEQNAALNAAMMGSRAGGGGMITSGGGGWPSLGVGGGYDSGGMYNPSSGTVIGSGTGTMAGAFGGMTDNGDGTMTDEYGLTYDSMTGLPTDVAGYNQGYDLGTGTEDPYATAPASDYGSTDYGNTDYSGGDYSGDF